MQPCSSAPCNAWCYVALLCAAGAPDQVTGLGFSGFDVIWVAEGFTAGRIQLRNLVLHGLPVGPPDEYPAGLLTALLWPIAGFPRNR